MKTDEAEILVAKSSAVFTHDGMRYRLISGQTTARRGSPFIQGREHLFRPLVVDFDLDGAEVTKQAVKRGRPRKEETVEAFKVDVVEPVVEHPKAEETPKAEAPKAEAPKVDPPKEEKPRRGPMTTDSIKP